MLSECSELKKIIKDKKISPVELRVFLPCFLNQRHYFLFELGYINSSKVHETEEYLVIDTNEAWFIVGTDDSGKYFTRITTPYPSHSEPPTNEEVRSLLGFRYHKHEINTNDIQNEISIRIQGDLILSIHKIFENSFDIVNHLLNYRSVLVERYVHDVLVKNEKYRKIVELWENYLYFYDLSRSLKIKTTSYISYYISYYRKQLEKELKKLGIQYGKLKRKGITLLDIPDFTNQLIQKFVDFNEFYQYLIETQEYFELRLGHFIRPHVIRLRGHQYLNNHYLILEPQEIEITHPEHGKDTFYIPKQCLIYFYTS